MVVMAWWEAKAAAEQSIRKRYAYMHHHQRTGAHSLCPGREYKLRHFHFSLWLTENRLLTLCSPASAFTLLLCALFSIFLRFGLFGATKRRSFECAYAGALATVDCA